MQASTKNRRQRSRRIMLTWLACFVGVEVVFGLMLQGPLDFIRNPDYAARSASLRALRHEHADKPFVLVLGSSRVQQALRPDLISDRPDQPFVYNFARAGYGPVQHVVTFKRLLRDGLKPDNVVLELAPHQLTNGVDFVRKVNLLDYKYADMIDSLPYRDEPEQARREWVDAQWKLPCFSYRYHLISHALPSWVPAGRLAMAWRVHDPYGWMPYPRGKLQTSPEVIRAYFGAMLTDWQVEEANRKAVEEILATCRRERIGVVVLFMPEGPFFRSFYPPQTETALLEFQKWLTTFPGVKVVNARQWLDEERFYVDSHHLDADSAPLFTGMFVQRVLPLLPATTGDPATAQIKLR